MQCPCGDTVNFSGRVLYSDNKAREWSEDPSVKAPVALQHGRCDSCGRESRIVYAMDGKEIMRKGM